ncbi:hypothetical protein CVV67_17205 [Arthrobacter stackebrandtii]|nr:hypothetical protein CVV67_17205 [Arthrobacter stackebrandtii]
MAEAGRHHAQAARWAKEDRFSMRYGATALLTGWFVTFLVFCLGLTAAHVVAEGGTGFGWNFLTLALIFGFPVAVVVGLPLAILIAWPLRRVDNQWLHVAGFALGVGAAMALATALISGFDKGAGWWVLLLALWTAVSAAMGRASVMGMVARRNLPVAGALPPAQI